MSRPLEPVPIERLREVWPTVEPMLLQVKEKRGSRWITADIYHGCASGRSGLFLMRDDAKEITGCLVAEPVIDWGVPVLHLWICFHKDPNASMADYWDAIVGIARQSKSRIVRADGREGFEKIVPMRKVHAVLEYEVPQ